MPNPTITLVDGPADFTRDQAITALRTTNFISHQADWFLDQISTKVKSGNLPATAEIIRGYSGIKKLTPRREEAVNRIATLVAQST